MECRWTWHPGWKQHCSRENPRQWWALNQVASILTYFVVGPLPWLREFALLFRKYHVMLKVSLSFDGLLSKRFVSTACPDPFCGDNGPAPENSIAAFCTSNGAGAAIKHYHIPARFLSPAPPWKKNQECLILDGPHRGLIRTLVLCSAKHANVKISITPTITITLRFDQICLVELMRS